MRFVLSITLLLFISQAVFSQQLYSPRTFVKKCKKYKGTPYKLGGNDHKGIDCSGILKNVFNDLEVDFPRASIEQSKVFKKVKLKRSRKGDLVYFKTSGDQINHTGVIVKKKGRRKLLFLHASSSKGVRIDNLRIPYWEDRFVKATRPLEYRF